MGLLSNQINNSKSLDTISNDTTKKQEELLNVYKNVIDKNKYRTSHSELLSLLNLNPENKTARGFASLTNEAKDGVEKNKDQLIVMGKLFKELDNEVVSFIKEAINLDKQNKEKLDPSIINNPDKYIDLKYFIVESLKNPTLSGVNSIGSLSLLKEIYSMDNIRSKNQVIQNGANLKPLADEIEKIQVSNPSKDDINNLNNIYDIIKNTMNQNKENEEKLKEIQDLLLSINKQFEENQNQIKVKEQKFEEELQHNEISSF